MFRIEFEGRVQIWRRSSPQLNALQALQHLYHQLLQRFSLQESPFVVDVPVPGRERSSESASSSSRARLKRLRNTSPFCSFSWSLSLKMIFRSSRYLKDSSNQKLMERTVQTAATRLLSSCSPVSRFFLKKSFAERI